MQPGAARPAAAAEDHQFALFRPAEAQAAAREAIDFEGPSALIFRSPCVQLVKPAAPVSVDPDLCTGCKKCITEIGCPGLGFAPDAKGPRSKDRGQAFVDAGQCNGCGLCTQICPFNAIKKAAAPSPQAAGDTPDAASNVKEADRD